MSKRAPVACYADETESLRDTTGCGGAPLLKGSLPIPGTSIRVRVRGELDDLWLRTFDAQTRKADIIARLRPRRIKGKPGQWQARVPSRLNATPNYLYAQMNLPRGAFAIYELGVGITR